MGLLDRTTQSGSSSASGSRLPSNPRRHREAPRLSGACRPGTARCASGRTSGARRACRAVRRSRRPRPRVRQAPRAEVVRRARPRASARGPAGQPRARARRAHERRAARASLRLPDGLVSGEPFPRVMHLSKGERRELHVPIQCVHWGTYVVGRALWRARDGFGLLVFEGSLGAPESAGLVRGLHGDHQQLHPGTDDTSAPATDESRARSRTMRSRWPRLPAVAGPSP